jgi:hypothetical protein
LLQVAVAVVELIMVAAAVERVDIELAHRFRFLLA